MAHYNFLPPKKDMIAHVMCVAKNWVRPSERCSSRRSYLISQENIVTRQAVDVIIWILCADSLKEAANHHDNFMSFVDFEI